MKQVPPEPLPKIPGKRCLRESNNHITPKAARRGAPATTGGAFVPGGPSPAQMFQIPLIFTSSGAGAILMPQLGLLTPWKNHKSLVLKARDIPVMPMEGW